MASFGEKGKKALLLSRRRPIKKRVANKKPTTAIYSIKNGILGIADELPSYTGMARLVVRTTRRRFYARVLRTFGGTYTGKSSTE